MDDINLENLTLRIRAGKGGKSAIIPIPSNCAKVMKEYLKICPQLKIDGRQPLFYTDRGACWNRVFLYSIFRQYKKKAGIQKKGGLHVFSRHSPATMMIAQGCDIRIVKELLRHKSILTTERYAHVSTKTIKEASEKYLVI